MATEPTSELAPVNTVAETVEKLRELTGPVGPPPAPLKKPAPPANPGRTIGARLADHRKAGALQSPAAKLAVPDLPIPKEFAQPSEADRRNRERVALVKKTVRELAEFANKKSADLINAVKALRDVAGGSAYAEGEGLDLEWAQEIGDDFQKLLTEHFRSDG